MESASRLVFKDGAFENGVRQVAEETAVAISVNGSTHAVMMASPEHLGDLATGLALNEGIVDAIGEIERIEIEAMPLGVDCRLWLAEAKAKTYTARRRQMTGPVGCGLCGVESLELAGRDIPAVAEWSVPLEPGDIAAAVSRMADLQELSRATRAVHAAAFHRFGGHGGDETKSLVVLREDVGRHNALDKVAGHLAERGIDPAGGFLTITSRVSVELIQKAATMGCGLIAAVSAPTALAIREAARAGITLVAVVRGAEFEIFSRPERIAGATGTGDVADVPVAAGQRGTGNAAGSSGRTARDRLSA